MSTTITIAAAAADAEESTKTVTTERRVHKVCLIGRATYFKDDRLWLSCCNTIAVWTVVVAVVMVVVVDHWVVVSDVVK